MPEPKKVWNPPNSYLNEHRYFLGEPPAADIEFFEDQSNSALSTQDS